MLFRKHALDTRLQIANETCSAELVIIFSYASSASGIVALFKMSQNNIENYK